MKEKYDVPIASESEFVEYIDYFVYSECTINVFL